MTDEERLVELLEQTGMLDSKSRCEIAASELLAKGVIVAPMPMADWLREELTEYVYDKCMEEL